MCNLSHWRILADKKRVVCLSFAEVADDLCPPYSDDGIVRAELGIGGYVLTPTENGTFVQYVVQVSW